MLDIGQSRVQDLVSDTAENAIQNGTAHLRAAAVGGLQGHSLLTKTKLLPLSSVVTPPHP